VPAAALGAALLLAGCGGGGDEAATTAEPAPPPPETTPPPAETAPPPPLGPLAFPAGAGTFVWHESFLDPERFAATLRASGFDWVALRVHDGLLEDPTDPNWLERYRRAGGPPLGAWGVLRDRPEEEAALAQRVVAAGGFAFYIANAEAEYAYTGPDGQSSERHGRSSRFVQAFRALAPDLPAALSSYCRADRNDLDWAAWRAGGFHFFPQAYVNDFGPEATPAVCVDAARAYFDAAAVHPTIGSYVGSYPVTASEYAELLAQSGADGFSVYLAEVEMPDESWRTLGALG
jgi:hypothetical protein